MRKPSPQVGTKSQRGSVLLAVVFASLILTVAAILLIDWSMNTLKSTVRKQMINQAENVAHNELELLFYKWASVVDKTSNLTIDQQLQGLTVNDVPVAVLEANVTSDASAAAPFLQAIPGTEGLKKDDAIVYFDSDHKLNVDLGSAPATAGHGAIGAARSITSRNELQAIGVYKVPGPVELLKAANVGYYDAKVRVIVFDPSLNGDDETRKTGTIEVRYGRRFTSQKVSPMQSAIFYQGNLELSPGSNMDIIGDVQSNTGIFIGAQSGKRIRASGNLYFVTTFNGSSDPAAGTQHRMFGTDTLHDPIFTRNFNGEDPPQGAQRLDQVKKLTEGDNLLGSGNLTPQQVFDKYASQANSPYETVNDVYRAIIAPPPSVEEEPSVANYRLYNKASLKITVSTGMDGQPVTTITDSTGRDLSTSYADVIVSTRSDMTDSREDKVVKVTTIDVNKLREAINSDSTMKSAYNGVVYVYDKEDSVASTKGIRLVNAEEVPNFGEKGFVVGSNNAVYVQGDFNTKVNGAAVSLDDTAHCAIAGDAVTVISKGWRDENSASGLFATEEAPNARLVASGDDIKINSAIVSGNTPTTSTSSASGGAQNLIRYLENWAGHTTEVNGSLVQMFESKYFKSPYRGNVWTDPATGITYNVYIQPDNRILQFDRRLAQRPPAGMPSSKSNFYRGDLFVW